MPKQQPATLAVEQHNGTLWLCAVAAHGVTMLARFSDPAAAERFTAILGHTIAAAHAAGVSGI